MTGATHFIVVWVGMVVERRTLGRHVRDDGVVAQTQSGRAQDVEVSLVDQLHTHRNDAVSAPPPT